MDVSVIIGTYNRLSGLQRAITSARHALLGLRYEFVISDNGSSDGTWAWLQSQPDVRALQMGAPVGAVRAFTEAAYAAIGKYVLIMTDDVSLHARTVHKSLRHLENAPTCGTVTFFHNKNPQRWECGVHPARDTLGNRRPALYPQISLTRRWLGDVVGWWGGRHPVMGQAFTYGGDNFLGAGIVELGYRVDSIEGAVNFEHSVDDASRRLSVGNQPKSQQVYLSLYPHGPLIQDVPQIPPRDGRGLRVLNLQAYINPPHAANKQTIVGAWRRFGAVVDYDYRTHGMTRLTDVAADYRPHIIFAQLHNPDAGLNADVLRMLRLASPSSLLITWNGDVWARNIDRPDTRAALAETHLSLFQCQNLVKRAEGYGICAAYWPASFEEMPAREDMPAYRAVFLGNGYDDSRRALGAFVKAQQGGAVYGRFPNFKSDGLTHYDMPASFGLYKNATYAISPNQFRDSYGYSSNRLWEIVQAGGALCLQQQSAGLDELTGLKAGVHYVAWTDVSQLPNIMSYFDEHPLQRQQIVDAARAYVWENHRYQHRVETIIWQHLRKLGWAYDSV